METVLKAIADWIKGILTAGIMSNLSGLFDDVNTQVGNIAQQVGTKPSSFEPRVFAMIEALSRNVVLPIAGIILTFIACYELIEMITQHNNMAQFEPALIMRWIFKTAISVWLISNTFDIVMAVFDVTQKVVSDSSSIIAGNTHVNDIGLSMLQSSLMQMDVGPLFGLFLQSFFIGITMRILSIVIFVIVYGRMIEIYCIPYQRDGFDDVRAEYSQMLRQQLAKGNNGLTKTKFITFGVEGESMAQVKPRLDHIQNDLLNNFHRLGVQAKPLNGAQRLKLMHDMFNMDGASKFHFDWKDLVKSGLSVKDAIAPTAFAFKNSRTFQMGGIYCAASFLSITASDISDQLLKDFLDMDSSQIVTISNSKNVTFANITLQNSHFWTSHLYRCDHVKYLNCRIFSPAHPVPAPSTDAIDIDVCTNVLVKNCYLEVNDDSVVLKGGKGPWADTAPENGTNERILVEDCHYGFCHGCLTCGSESMHDRNILIRRLKVDHACNLLWLKMRPDTPQHYEYITMQQVDAVVDSFVNINPWTQFYDLEDRKDIPLSYADHITVEDCRCDCREYFNVKPEPIQYRLSDFTFRDLKIRTAENSFDPAAVEGMICENCTISALDTAPDINYILPVSHTIEKAQ